MPKISQLSDPGSSYTVTGAEKLVVTTPGLTSISLSANDLISRALDVTTDSKVARWNSTFTTVNENSSVFAAVQSNSANWVSTYNQVQDSTTDFVVDTTTLVVDKSADNVGIGVLNPAEKLSVLGNISASGDIINTGRTSVGGVIDTNNNLTVYGTISASGTIYSAGSAIGSGGGSGTPGGSDKQFQYNDSSAFNGADMYYDESGTNVGIGTSTPNEKLTVVGDISALGDIHTTGTVDGRDIAADGLKIDSTYSTVNGSSATWDLVFNSSEIAANSGSWNSTNTTVNNNSATWDLAFNSSGLAANSGSWNSTNTTVKNNSATWDTHLSEVISSSANWDSTYNQVQDDITDLVVDTDVFVVDKSADKVGIGTTTPGYKLHVVEGSSSTIAISAYGAIHAAGDIISSSSSDKRQKSNVINITDPLHKLGQLNGVEYDWNDLAPDYYTGKHDVGVIAQEVETVLPEAIEHREDGLMGVRYERLVPLLIESIKELKREIDELKSK